MISQYVCIFFLVYTTVQIIKLAVGGEAAMYFICSHASHLRHSPWRLKGIRTHPALQLSVIKSEGVWQGFCLLPFHIVQKLLSMSPWWLQILF